MARKDTKKASVDTFFGRNTDDRHSKRATSESKEKITKRNASSPAAISMLSVAADHKHDKGKSLKASPELLAELLRGSSEKMSTTERERNKKAFYYDSISLPVAVQKFMVSNTYIVISGRS